MFNLWDLLAICTFSVQTLKNILHVHFKIHVHFNIYSATLNKDLNQNVSILTKINSMVQEWYQTMSDRPIHKPIFGHFEMTEFN